MEELSSADVWVIVAASLVLLMTPGLAFFYGGMTRAKSALNMIMMSFISMGIVAVVWVLWAYSISGGGSGIGGLFGNPAEAFGLMSLAGSPDLIGAGFGATFAIITVALISGALADRTRFAAWLVFVPVWVTLVYAPLAYMVWGDGGLFTETGAIGGAIGEAIDYAGGTVVHINAGVAALVLALIIGKRKGLNGSALHRPHNVPLVMLGAAMLWFGWFGFNGGAATDPAEAGLIWVNTLVTPAAAMLAWLATEKIRDGKYTSIGAASGVVAGLVAITPACANLDPWAAILLGVISGVAACLAVGLKYRLGYDDALDVVGVHLVAGLIGTLYLGFFAFDGVGLFYGGGGQQLIVQVVAAVVSIVFTAVLTFIIGTIIHRTIGFRVSEEQEDDGIDISLADELAYEFVEEKVDVNLVDTNNK